ncbi:RagB/SusD family nutrient uptake outer membrane protein, partial [Bacteroides ovatus]
AIDDNDTRKKWFTAPTGMTPDEEDEDANLKPEDVSYNQLKFRVKSIGTWNSDYIYMRMAEMYLIAAEAECRQGNEHFSKAKSLLKEVVSYKYEDPSEYENKVDGLQESNNITLTEENTTSTTLLDEILLQRRIELWGEGVRLLDYRRYVDPENWELTMMIPMTEFDGNESLNIATDQNP